MSDILAKDKMGKCSYVVRLVGKDLVAKMQGYGLEGTETHRCTHKDFNDDVAAHKEKMRLLERRMGDLARLTTALQANNISGVARLATPSVRRKATGVNPSRLSKIKV